MQHRLRLLGAVIMACGLAVCYGAVQLWPGPAAGTMPPWPLAALRIAAAGVAIVIGVLNVAAGTVVLLWPARD